MVIDVPVTAAVRFLRERRVDFTPRIYKYVDKGGTAESAKQFGVDEREIVKTLVFETSEKSALIVLMHGDKEVSTKSLARHLSVKSVAPVSPDKASKLTGYLVGGTSPFGTRTKLPVYVEKTIFTLDHIFINGGKRGFLVEIDPAALRLIDAREVEVGI